MKENKLITIIPSIWIKLAKQKKYDEAVSAIWSHVESGKVKQWK